MRTQSCSWDRGASRRRDVRPRVRGASRRRNDIEDEHVAVAVAGPYLEDTEGVRRLDDEADIRHVVARRAAKRCRGDPPLRRNTGLAGTQPPPVVARTKRVSGPGANARSRMRAIAACVSVDG